MSLVDRAGAARIAEAAFAAEGTPGSVREVLTIGEVRERFQEPSVYGLEIAEADWIVYWEVDRGRLFVIGPSTIAVVSANGELRYLGSAMDEG